MPAPSNPGPGGPASAVSGPGQLARRTDQGPAQKLMQLPDAQYGENATFQGLQQGAALAQSGQTPTASPPQAQPGYEPNPAAANVIPFSAPTQRPNEPVTAGASEGPGPGPEALGIMPQQAEQQDMTQLSVHMPILEAIANLPSATASSRLWVNLIKANS